MTVPIPPWEPKIVVDDNDPDVARIDLPAQHEKGQNRPHLLLDASPESASWQSATISILEFGLPIRRTRDARNLARALLAGTAWIERKSLDQRHPGLPTEQIYQAAQNVIADIEKFSPDNVKNLTFTPLPRPHPDFDPRMPGSRLQGQIDYTSSHAMYRGPEGEWSVSWEPPKPSSMDEINRINRFFEDNPPSLMSLVKAGITMPVSNETKAEFYLVFGEPLTTSELSPEQIEWLDARHKAGLL